MILKQLKLVSNLLLKRSLSFKIFKISSTKTPLFTILHFTYFTLL